jgi:hypothetical protein
MEPAELTTLRESIAKIRLVSGSRRSRSLDRAGAYSADSNVIVTDESATDHKRLTAMAEPVVDAPDARKGGTRGMTSPLCGVQVARGVS